MKIPISISLNVHKLIFRNTSCYRRVIKKINRQNYLDLLIMLMYKKYKFDRL